MNDYDKGLRNCTGKLGKEESMLMMLQASIQSALHSGCRGYEYPKVAYKYPKVASTDVRYWLRN